MTKPANVDHITEAREAVLSRFRWIIDHADMWPVFADPSVFATVIRGLADPFRGSGITRVVGIEARGFLLGGALARELEAGFVPIRKIDGLFPGEKLFAATAPDYRGIEHILRIQKDSLTGTDRVLFVDDWAETGSQLIAAAKLTRECGAEIVGYSLIVNQLIPEVIQELGNVQSLVQFEELPIPECCAQGLHD